VEGWMSMNLFQVETTLYPKPPYDFQKALTFLEFFKPMKDKDMSDNQRLVKAVDLGEQSVLFCVHSSGSLEEPELKTVIFSLVPISDSIFERAKDRISFSLSIDDDLTEFYRIGREDEVFSPIIDTLYGYHQAKFLTPFENACWAIISQRTPMNVAKIIRDRLTQTYGSFLHWDNKDYYAFPSVEKLVDIGYDELNGVIHNQRKTDYLLSVIEAFSKVDENDLRYNEYEKVKDWLLGIKGIGDWSASFILLRGLGRMDEVPITEKVLGDVLRKLYQIKDVQEIKNIGGNYKKNQGYWAHYIRGNQYPLVTSCA
jgi:DNA-3-methyladenine glycosylase II